MSSLAAVARETLAILERGHYSSPGGGVVQLGPLVDRAREGTRLYTPEELGGLAPAGTGGRAPRFEVTGEGTVEAAERLVRGERSTDLVALNFASARNPGGGFLGNVRTQEEDLARRSGLYPCLREQPRYYEANRACGSLLYTDHLIYSPAVPFFRSGPAFSLLDEPYTAAVITCPAPNAGEALRREPQAGPEIQRTLERRAGHLLRVAAAQGHRSLLLGAWGCGVFRNDARAVAEIFASWLLGDLGGCFDRVVFAVLERSAAQGNLRAFQDRFGS